MHFGIMKLCRIPYAGLARDIREAEAMDFDSAWVDDDLFSPEYADYEVWTVLAALAAQTERIRLGSLVTVPTFRSPAVLAGHVLTVDHISDGRIELGLGAGGAKESYPAVGVEPWSPRERSERLDEYAAILSRMLRGESIAYTGRFYATDVVHAPPPIQNPRPPLVIAAHGDRGLRTVARYADGWNTLLGVAGPGVDDPKAPRDLAEAVANLKQRCERLDAICAEEDRDPATVRRSVLMHRPRPDPWSSVDAFDEVVGVYQAIGIDQIIFYWPPLSNTIPDPSGRELGPLGRVAGIPVTSAQRRAFEHVVAERISNR